MNMAAMAMISDNLYAEIDEHFGILRLFNIPISFHERKNSRLLYR
jgi:hypothetical protein